MNSQHPQAPDQGSGVPEEKPIPDPTVSMLNAEDEFYLLGDPEDEENSDPLGMHNATPFQMSQAMPPVQNTSTVAHAQSGYMPPPSSPATPRQRQRRKFSPLLVAVVATVVVVVVITMAMTTFAQTTPKAPTATTGAAPGQPTTKGTPRGAATLAATQPPKGTATPIAHPAATPAPQTNHMPSWTDQKLPDGWQNANLATSDAIEASRTALAFTDREMGLDFRNMGTRAAHGGTFTAAFFILTSAAKARFSQNDVRVINNTLFDRVANQKLIEAAVDATPKVVQFQQQGKQQFAWVDVSFHLWQSQTDPNNPQQRIEGLDMDQKTQQPRTHHMVVLLKRAAPEKQGPGAPMGGTGWLVSNYGLDLQALPDIVQPA